MCQKPAPSLLLQAQKEHKLEFEKCVVVGDVGTDVLAADQVGCVKILERTGWGEGSLAKFRNLWAGVEADYVALDIHDAAKWILKTGDL